MATGIIPQAVDESIYPTYTEYVNLSSYAQGATFTVSRTGFYCCLVSATSGSTKTDFGIRLGSYDVYRTTFTGTATGGLVYLKAGVTYTVLVKTNVNVVYLYY